VNFLVSNLGDSSFSIRAESSKTPLALLYGCIPVEISIFKLKLVTFKSII
jgi:hypothetical protein